MSDKKRVDVALVERGLAQSREKAQALVMSGVVYIGDLAAGEYYVELLPISGYRVPENETRVRVKDKVEYVAIEDISLLIKTEADIDAEAEDTEIADALEDADKQRSRSSRTRQGTAG